MCRTLLAMSDVVFDGVVVLFDGVGDVSLVFVEYWLLNIDVVL